MASPVAPQISDEARRAALDKARRTVQERANVRRRIKAGELSIGEALSMDLLQGMRVRQLVASFPGVGQVKSVRVMEECAICDTRRVRGLTDRQRRALLEYFAKSH